MKKILNLFLCSYLFLGGCSLPSLNTINIQESIKSTDLTTLNDKNPEDNLELKKQAFYEKYGLSESFMTSLN